MFEDKTFSCPLKESRTALPCLTDCKKQNNSRFPTHTQLRSPQQILGDKESQILWCKNHVSDRLLHELSKSNYGKGNSVHRTATMDSTTTARYLQFFTFFILYLVL